MNITINTNGNYPIAEGAGALGDIVNQRWKDQWIHENQPRFASFDSVAVDVLVEDYNERHATNKELEAL